MPCITSAIASDALTTLSGAQSAIANIDLAIQNVDTKRAEMGALINRFQYTVDNLTNVVTNASASRSRIVDADYSQATADLAKTQIIQQAGNAILAQANQMPQMVLALLRARAEVAQAADWMVSTGLPLVLGCSTVWWTIAKARRETEARLVFARWRDAAAAADKAKAEAQAAEEAVRNAKSDIDLARAQSELAVMAAQIAALRQYRAKK